MKKFNSFVLVMFLIMVMHPYGNCAYSQYGWQKIYSDTTFRVIKFNSVKNNNISRKLIFIQMGLNYNPFGNPNESGRYLKLNKTNNTWFIPSNGFINAHWCFCFCPFTCNPPRYVCLPVMTFIVSPVDTQFVFKGLLNSCGCDAGDGVYKTYNSGINFVLLNQFSNGFIGVQCRGIDIDPFNDSVVYVGYPSLQQGLYSCIFKSTDRGNNWFITDTISTLAQIPDGFIKINPLRTSDIFVNAFPNMMLSINAGYNFFTINVPRFKTMAFDPIDNSIYGITQTTIYKSTNNGLNWVQLNISGNFHSIEISPDNHNIVYAGSEIGLYRSNNGGASWFLYNDSFNPSKRVIGLSKDVGTGETLFAATNDAVYKVWGNWVGLSSKSSTVPDRFSLFQNYPNPFNPVTKIKFDVPQSVFLSGAKNLILLKVYDILGREITILINEELKPGTYEVEWDASNYPSGVYYYRLTAGDYKETRKMVLLK